MPRLRALALILVLAVITTAGGFGQDKKDPVKEKVKETTKELTKAKGRLPAYWTKIGLSDQQKQEIYKIQTKYEDEMAKLKAQLKEMESKQKTEMEKVLTEEQKKRLVEVILGSKSKD